MDGFIKYFVFGTSFVGVLNLIYEILKIFVPSITVVQ